jgi:hypothetical protein
MPTDFAIFDPRALLPSVHTAASADKGTNPPFTGQQYLSKMTVCGTFTVPAHRTLRTAPQTVLFGSEGSSAVGGRMTP